MTLSLLVGAVPALADPARHDARVARPAGSGDVFARTLAGDGAFRGSPGVAGTVDAGAWTLVSNLAAGEAPRFAPAAATPAGTWAALGSSTDGTNGAIGSFGPVVNAIAVIGTDLYVGGQFTNVAGIPEADYIAMWNGSAWSALGSNGSGDGALNLFVNALAVSGNDLYVGGDFANAGGIPQADMVAKWSGGAWSALGSDGPGTNGAFGINSYVSSLAVYNGEVLASADGQVNVAGGGTRAGLVRFSGGAWTDVGGFDFTASALVVSGGFLYAASGEVARWDGSTWTRLGTGAGAIGGGVTTIAVSGTTVYAGGTFQNAAGIPQADYVAVWNGIAWSALGSNGAGDGALNGYVDAIAISGTDVYLGGTFYVVGGNPMINGIAKWGGGAWSALGSNGSGGAALGSGYARAFVVSGTDLIVGGAFANAGGIPQADYIATWGMVPTPALVRKSDGRIRLGTTGAYVGNNVYNTTGVGQIRTGSALRGKVITFGISVQNDGSAADAFKLKATGTSTAKYTVKYYRGTTDITAKVVAGTYQTTSLAPGGSFLVTAKVTVKSSATIGSSVTRLVTVTSVASAASKDAVKLVGKRK
jgi:hypothetical protein